MADSGKAGALVGKRLGKYDLLALLALGGTAEIYLARIGGTAGFEKYVVVKCLHDHLADDPDFVKMFLDEARLGAQLDHSNIVQTLELGQHDGRYFMVMEYLAGMSLAQVARKTKQRMPGGLLPLPIVLGLAAQACAGLHYAHQRTSTDGRPLNIVHRDMSPQNLVITFEGMLKIVDFGIAKAEKRETKTQSGTIKGKFAYMSPEQALAKDVDRRTDIFALGTLVHELLTGRRLFKRASAYETYQAIIAGEVAPPSAVNHQLDPSLDGVIMRALAYNPNDRYPTAEAFGEALLRALHQRGKSVSPSEVATLFDQYFQQEISEHAERMRGLIEGRQSEPPDEFDWDAGEGESNSAAQMPDEIGADGSPYQGAGADEGDEATRIELNPLARVEALHTGAQQAVGAASAAQGPNVQHDSRTIQARSPRKTLGPGAPLAAVPVNIGVPASIPSSIPAAIPAAAPPAQLRHAEPDQKTMMAGEAPSIEQIEAAAREADRILNAPVPIAAAPAPMPAAVSAPVPVQVAAQVSGPQHAEPDQKTMMAGEAPSIAQIEAAAKEADRILAAQNAPATADVDQKTMMAGEAPSIEQIQAAAREADRVLAAAAAPNAAQGQAAFPPIHTPTAFRSRGELIAEAGGFQPTGGDLAVLAGERAAGEGNTPVVLLAVAFFLAVAVGFGLAAIIAIVI